MKPGRLTCAGLVAIMMVLPNTLWRGAPPEAKVKVVVRVASPGLFNDEGLDPAHLHDVDRDGFYRRPTWSAQTPAY